MSATAVICRSSTLQGYLYRNYFLLVGTVFGIVILIVRPVSFMHLAIRSDLLFEV
jgi:hypothetical protein